MKKRICMLLTVLLLQTGTVFAAPAFSDVSPSDWFYTYVEAMVEKDLLSGYADGTFAPSGTLTQGEFLTLVARIFYPGTLRKAKGGRHWASNAYNAAVTSGVLTQTDFLPIDADSLGMPINRKTVSVLFDRLMTVVCEEQPLNTKNIEQTIVDFAEVDEEYREAVLQTYARGIVSGYTDGRFGPDRTLTRAESCVMLARAAGLELHGTSAPQPTAAWYVKGDNADKRIRVFGTDAVKKYENEEAAKQDIVEVCVPVWRLNKASGEKTASKQYFLINKAIADDVVAIFTEIFNDPSQFPIYEIGGYNWRSNANTSEHNSGLAIDINANENYQIYPDGRIGAGSYWLPDEDPFSIPEDGIVVTTFAKYGFAWGGNAWKSNHDYMHFSYFGT